MHGKRSSSSNNEGGSTAMSSGGLGNSGAEADPIPRPLKTMSLTVRIKQTSWEEISSNNLYYLPISSNLSSMFDDQNIQQITRWYSKCKSYSINDVKFRATNFIILNDILGAGANPSEISSIVQRAKIIHYVPKYKNGHAFNLYNENKAITFSDPSYTILPAQATTGQIAFRTATVPPSNRNYILKSDINTNFEDLSVMIQTLSGGVPIQPYNTAILGDIYYSTGYNWAIPGADQDAPSQSCLANYSGLQLTKTTFNNQGYTTEGSDYYIAQLKNHDFEILGGDDTIEEHVVTNYPSEIERKAFNGNYKVGPSSIGIDGSYNNFYLSGLLPLSISGNPATVSTYKYVPHYPCKQNPIIPKLAWASPQYLDWLQSTQNLRHHYLTMIPIKQETGGILNQRANFLFEQECIFTFNFDDGWADSNMHPYSGAQIRGSTIVKGGDDAIYYNTFIIS